MKKLIIIIGILLVVTLQILSLIGFIYDDYNKKINDVTKNINIPVASQNISKGTIITENMITIINKNNVDNKYYLNTTKIIGKVATKNINKNEMFSVNNLISNEIIFYYKDDANINNDITKPFLNYNNIYYYYTNSNQSLEVSYMNKKYSIDDIIRLNILSLDEILNQSSSKEKINQNTLYKYELFNLLLCNNNTIYITNNTNKNNYCN